MVVVVLIMMVIMLVMVAVRWEEAEVLQTFKSCVVLQISQRGDTHLTYFQLHV